MNETNIFLLVMGTIAVASGVASYKIYIKRYPKQKIDSSSIPSVWVLDEDTPKDTALPVETLKTPISAPQPHSKATLENLCLAIRDFEGKPGDQNYRLNNPGNARYSKEGYLKIYEPVKMSKNGFAIFPSYEIGWLYLKNMLKNKIKKHPDWTIYNLISHYAPAEDDNPVDNYARFVAKRLDVDISYKVKNLV